MAENAENGQDLAQDGVSEVTQPQVETNQTGETQESQTSEKTTEPEAQATDDPEAMPLEDLEARLTGKSTNVASETPAEPAVTKTKEEAKEKQPQALEKSNKTQRGENRYQELANENKQIKAELEQYRQAEKQRLSQKLNLENPPWKTDPAKLEEIPLPQLNENGELTPAQYRQEVQKQAEAIADAKIKARELQWQQQAQQQEAMRQLDADMDYIKRTYPELDPQSEKYLPELDEQISSLVSVDGQLNPVGLRARVDTAMKMRSSALARQQTQVKNALESQAEASAVIPSVTVPQAKEDLNKVSLDDLEERLGSVS